MDKRGIFIEHDSSMDRPLTSGYDSWLGMAEETRPDTAADKLSLSVAEGLLKDALYDRSQEVGQAKLDEKACNIILDLIRGLNQSLEQASSTQHKTQSTMIFKPKALILDESAYRENNPETTLLGISDLEDIRLNWHNERGYLILLLSEAINSAKKRYEDIIPSGVTIEPIWVSAEDFSNHPEKYTHATWQADYLDNDSDDVILEVVASLE